MALYPIFSEMKHDLCYFWCQISDRTNYARCEMCVQFDGMSVGSIIARVYDYIVLFQL